jgi:hypothetical protein
MTSFLPSRAGQSIVNSVTEDEDDCINRCLLKERTVPTQNSILPPLPQSSHLYSKNTTEWSGHAFSQNILPPPTQFHPEPTVHRRLPPCKECLDAEAYLARYERMTNEQEAELAATLAYLQPFFDLFVDLTTEHPQERAFKGATSLSKFFTVSQFQQILATIEESDIYQNVKTDKQFMMTLRLIAERSVGGNEENASVSLGEFLQCYRSCIVGAQTLELLPSGSSIRNQAKARTMNMLSTFGYSVTRDDKCGMSPHFSVLKPMDDIKMSKGKTKTKSPLYRFLATMALCVGTLGFWLYSKEKKVMQQQRLIQMESSPNATVSEPMNKTSKEEARQRKPPAKATAKPMLMQAFNNLESSIALQQLTKPVLAPIKSIRTEFGIQKTLGKPKVLSQEDPIKKRTSSNDELGLAMRKAPQDLLSSFKAIGVSSAVLYLLFPIVTANASWLPTCAAVLLATFKGQDIRSWLVKNTKKLIRGLENMINNVNNDNNA